jgi:hypothetical protein
MRDSCERKFDKLQPSMKVIAIISLELAVGNEDGTFIHSNLDRIDVPSKSIIVRSL